jgi:tol-pal system protein YbgF
MRTAAHLFVLAALALASGTASATASNKELEARANETDANIAALENRLNQSLVLLQQQVDGAGSELRGLRGQIEETKHELEKLRQQQRDLYADLDRRLLLLENAAGISVPGATGAPSAGEIVAADETAVYGDAFAALKAGRYDEAVRGFQLYLTKYPKGGRADNAAYWIGEAQYVQKDYAAALKSFESVLDGYPDSTKAPDAMLRIGYCQYELKAYTNARTTLKKVVSSYPDTEAARLATQRLTDMDAEGR